MQKVLTSVPANTPVLVEAQGEVIFMGSGEVSYATCRLSDEVLPIVIPTAISSIRQISSDQPCYDLHGKRVNDSYRGVVIRSGKKIYRQVR